MPREYRSSELAVSTEYRIAPASGGKTHAWHGVAKTHKPNAARMGLARRRRVLSLASARLRQESVE